MMISAGDIIHIYCSYINPPKNKFAVCLCPDKPLFFFINSQPFILATNAQLLITKKDCPFLAHDSYINTASPITFPHYQIEKAEIKGSLNLALRNNLKTIIQAHNRLAKQLVSPDFKGGST